MEVKSFTFNAFAENTYVLYDNTKECIIIDPGCNNDQERNQLVQFLSENDLQPVRLINTHCHIDHVLGNKFISEKYELPLESHKGEVPVLDSCTMVSNMYQIPYDTSPKITKFLAEEDLIAFGDSELSILFTPGHSPASISFYHKDSGNLIAGDVLFQQSIGRTDLPGGDYDTLIASIKQKFFVLPNETVVYPGHGPSTTIGYEKEHNPFLK